MARRKASSSGNNASMACRAAGNALGSETSTPAWWAMETQAHFSPQKFPYWAAAWSGQAPLRKSRVTFSQLPWRKKRVWVRRRSMRYCSVSRPPVQNIPQDQQNVVGGKLDLFQQALEKGKIAVNVADDQHPPVRRQGEGTYNRSHGVIAPGLPGQSSRSFPGGLSPAAPPAPGRRPPRLPGCR